MMKVWFRLHTNCWFRLEKDGGHRFEIFLVSSYWPLNTHKGTKDAECSCLLPCSINSQKESSHIISVKGW